MSRNVCRYKFYDFSLQPCKNDKFYDFPLFRKFRSFIEGLPRTSFAFLRRFSSTAFQILGFFVIFANFQQSFGNFIATVYKLYVHFWTYLRISYFFIKTTKYTLWHMHVLISVVFCFVSLQKFTGHASPVTQLLFIPSPLSHDSNANHIPSNGINGQYNGQYFISGAEQDRLMNVW